MRRRYGIPDHDHRPFNVAYAAARLAQNDSRKLQDRIRNVPTFDQPNPLGHGSIGPGIVTNILINLCSSNESIEEGHGLATHPIPTPVTLQVSGLDKNAKQMCASFFVKFYGDSFFTSTQRSPFSASTATTQPLRAAVPSSHPHSDASGLHFQPECGHANARDEDAKDRREAMPEGYDALIFNV